MLARAAAERSSKMSSKMARKAFKNNWRQGEIHATFVPFVRVSTLEIRNKKLVVVISKSHSRNEAQIGIKSATHVQLTQQIQVIFGCISLVSSRFVLPPAPKRLGAVLFVSRRFRPRRLALTEGGNVMSERIPLLPRVLSACCCILQRHLRRKC